MRQNGKTGLMFSSFLGACALNACSNTNAKGEYLALFLIATVDVLCKKDRLALLFVNWEQNESRNMMLLGCLLGFSGMNWNE